MNKKLIIILVLSLTVVSIFVLGILAPAISQTFVTIKVTGVEIDKSDCIIVGEGENTNQVIRLEDDEREYQIVYKVFPVDYNDESTATNQNVSFDSNNELVSVSDTGLVTFPSDINKSISAIITVTTEDGKYTDQITVSYKYTKTVIVD